MRLGFYGGSFDPPHVGHLLAAVYAMSVGGLDKLIVVPTIRHAWKGTTQASLADRVNMLRMLFKNVNCTVDQVVEVAVGALKKPDEPVYTIEVLKRLQLFYPKDAEWRLIIGSDEFPNFSRWHRASELAMMAPLLVVPRHEGDNLEKAYGYCHRVVDVSSTLIRSMLADGETDRVKAYLPPDVLEYIWKWKLYGSRS